MDCQDHLGNRFKSKIEMCKYYNVSIANFNYRVRHGYSLESALTNGKSDIKRISDDNGNMFRTVEEMCKFYNISVDTYYQRLHNGITKQEALTGSTLVNRNIQNLDTEFSKNYSSIAALCRDKGISYKTVMSRINRGIPLSKALEPVKIYKDHLGNKYETLKEMCEHYNVSIYTYHWRRKQNYTLKECLLGKEPKIVTDYLGNKFHTVKEMCTYHNVKVSTYRERLKHGYSMKESLTNAL